MKRFSALLLGIASLLFFQSTFARDLDKEVLARVALHTSDSEDMVHDYQRQNNFSSFIYPESLSVKVADAATIAAKSAFSDVEYGRAVLNKLLQNMSTEELKVVLKFFQGDLFSSVFHKTVINSSALDDLSEKYLNDYFQKEKAKPDFKRRNEVIKGIAKVFIFQIYLSKLDEAYSIIRSDLIHCKDIFSKEYNKKRKEQNKDLGEGIEQFEPKATFSLKDSTLKELESFYKGLKGPEVSKFFSLIKEAIVETKKNSEMKFIREFEKLKKKENLCKEVKKT